MSLRAFRLFFLPSLALVSPGQAGRQIQRQTDGRGVEHARHAVAVALFCDARCSVVLYVSLQKGMAHTRSACVSAARLAAGWLLAGGRAAAAAVVGAQQHPHPRPAKKAHGESFGGVQCQSLPCRTLFPSGNYGLVPSSFGCVIDEASPPSDVIRPPPPIRTQPEPQPVPSAARPWNSGATPGPDGA